MRKKILLVFGLICVAVAAAVVPLLWVASGWLVAPVAHAQPSNAPYTDPCALLKWQYAPFSIAANTQAVAGVAGLNTFICSLVVNGSTTALSLSVVEGTGSTCGTNTTGMMGGATAATGGSIAVNGPGFSFPFTGRSAMQTATRGDSVCVFVSAQSSGLITFVQPALPF